MNIGTDPRGCIAMDSGIPLSSSSGWDLTMAPGGRADHNRLLLLERKLFHHILRHCGGSCYRLATWLTSQWVTSSIWAAWYGRKQVSMAHLCCVIQGRSLKGMEVLYWLASPDLLSLACSACFLIEPKTTSPGMAPPTRGVV